MGSIISEMSESISFIFKYCMEVLVLLSSQCWAAHTKDGTVSGMDMPTVFSEQNTGDFVLIVWHHLLPFE